MNFRALKNKMLKYFLFRKAKRSLSKALRKKANGKFIKDQRGEVEILLILFVMFLCISFIFPVTQPFITNANVTAMAKLVVEDVEFRGVVDSETQAMVRTLMTKFNLDDKNPTYSFTGSIKPSGKIQLRDEFVFEIKVVEYITFANFNERPIRIPITIHKKIVGQSQNFYRSNEI